MKRIVQAAVVVFACSAGAAWSQEPEEIKAQPQDAAVTVAQAGPGAGEQIAISREEARPRKIRRALARHRRLDTPGLRRSPESRAREVGKGREGGGHQA